MFELTGTLDYIIPRMAIKLVGDFFVRKKLTLKKYHSKDKYVHIYCPANHNAFTKPATKAILDAELIFLMHAFEHSKDAPPQTTKLYSETTNEAFGDAELKPGTESELIEFDRKVIKAQAGEMERKLDADLADVEKAVRLFLNSQFSDAEAHLKTRYAVSLYHAHGFGLISMMRAVLTFEPQDIESARDSLKRTVDMCKVLRKEQTLVAGIFQSITGGNGVGNMNRLQKHAELIHAESLLFRAMLSLVGDNANLIGLVQQGLTIRAAYSIYKTMYQHFDKVYQEHGVPGLTKEGIDRHLISGVVCGMGCFSLMLSLLPSKILRIFELVGFSGDRDSGLRFLEHGGGWDRRPKVLSPPSITPTSSPMGSKRNKRQGSTTQKLSFVDAIEVGGGIRKFMCDLMLSIHHVVISTLLQLHDMDIGFADEILRRQLDQSPNSVIFLGLSARLKQTKLEPQKALAEYERVIAECHEWRHLSHGTLWDMGICYGSTLNWPKVYECFETLERESRWSKAVYLYMMAAALDAQGDQPQRVIDLMNEVPGATKKVAGKSVPIEKLIARKARKFRDQGCRLMLPALEILYFFNVFEFMTDDPLEKCCQMLDKEIKKLDEQLEKAKDDSANDDALPYDNYYDDVCLARLLKGVALREQALPGTKWNLLPIADQAKITDQLRASSSSETGEKSIGLADPKRKASGLEYARHQLEFVMLQSQRIRLDHWMLPFARYELAQIKLRMGDFNGAKVDFDAAVNGGFADLEAAPRGWPLGKNGQGKKASMEPKLHILVHNSLLKLEALNELIEKSV